MPAFGTVYILGKKAKYGNAREQDVIMEGTLDIDNSILTVTTIHRGKMPVLNEKLVIIVDPRLEKGSIKGAYHRVEVTQVKNNTANLRYL